MLPYHLHVDVLCHDLLAQGRNIDETKPSLSVLAALYQVRKSYIDQWIEWYADNPWWGKFLAASVVVSISYTVGALIGIGWLLTGLVTALYMAAIFILEEHAACIKQRDTLFLEDIPKMEALFKASMESFRVLEDKLRTVFQSLNTLNTQRSQGVSVFEDKNSTMEKHNVHYTSLINSLETTVKKFSEPLDPTLAVDCELKTQASFESPISKQTEKHFDEIDRKIALYGHLSQTPKAHTNEDLSAMEQRLNELFLADSANKANHETCLNKNIHAYSCTMPALF